MTIRIRPHHLLCILTYAGKGYTPSFTVNFDAIARRVGSGEGLLIVSGPDDICSPLLAEERPHCLGASVAGRDRDAAIALKSLVGKEIRDGLELTLDETLLAGMRAAFSQGVTRKACQGCEWRELCTSIAHEGFAGTRILQAHPVSS